MIVGWTDLQDVSTRPVQLIAGRTWKGSMFGGEANDNQLWLCVKFFVFLLRYFVIMCISQALRGRMV